MSLVGRTQETGLLKDTLASDLGAARILLGAPGYGKSALLRDLAQSDDAVLVTVNRSERAWPYSGLTMIGSALGGARKEAIDALVTHVDEWSEFRFAEALRRALQACRDSHVRLLIDDIDELDDASARAFAYLLRRVHGTGLAVVASARSLGAASPFHGLTHSLLGPLAHADAVTYASAILGPSADPGVLDIVATFTGGVPGAIEQVHLTSQELVGAAPVPLPLRLSSSTRAEREGNGAAAVTPEASAVAKVLALAPFTAAQVFAEDVPAEKMALEDLVEEGVVELHGDGLRIADPLLRLSLHRSMDTAERQGLHRRAFEAARGTAPASELWHASFDSDGSDVAPALLAHAVAFAEHEDTMSAVEYAERSLRIAPTHGESAAALLALAEHLCRHGRFALAGLYLKRARAAGLTTLDASATVWSLRITDALTHTVDDAVIDSFLTSAEGSEPAESVRVLAEAARLELRRGRMAEAARRAAQALDLLPIPARRDIVLLQLAGMTRGIARSGEVADTLLDPVTRAAYADACSLPLEEWMPSVAALLRLLTIAERYDACRRAAEYLLDRLPPAEAFWREEVLYLLLANEVRYGDAVSARAVLCRWQRVSGDQRGSDAASELLTATALALDPGLTEEDGDEVRRQIERGRTLCREERHRRLLLMFDVLEAGRALAAGRSDEAADLLLGVARVLDPLMDPSLVRYHADLIEALWLSGRRQEARAQLAAFEDAQRASPSRWATLALARARAVCGSSALGARGFEEALALHGLTDSPDERHRLLAARRRCRMTESAEQMTADEREVVRLVARGLRNREIAGALFLSQRTVELRLTTIYRKLGVSSRSQLTALIADAA